MTYTRKQYEADKKHGVFRVNDICFEDSADNKKIEEVISEISSMKIVAPALMTREALCLYLNAPKYVCEKMAAMPIGDSFVFDGITITRWSNLTYNGKNG